MADEYGSDFMTIVDEDGTEYELEILTTLEYNGCTYLAVTAADDEEAESLVTDGGLRTHVYTDADEGALDTTAGDCPDYLDNLLSHLGGCEGAQLSVWTGDTIWALPKPGRGLSPLHPAWIFFRRII